MNKAFYTITPEQERWMLSDICNRAERGLAFSFSRFCERTNYTMTDEEIAFVEDRNAAFEEHALGMLGAKIIDYSEEADTGVILLFGQLWRTVPDRTGEFPWRPVRYADVRMRPPTSRFPSVLGEFGLLRFEKSGYYMWIADDAFYTNREANWGKLFDAVDPIYTIPQVNEISRNAARTKEVRIQSNLTEEA